MVTRFTADGDAGHISGRAASVRVRTRSGFIGVTDEEAKPVRRTRAEQIIAAITSPFASGDVRVRLTALFGGYVKGGAFVSSLMHIDMSNVRFTDEAEGWHKAVLDLVAFTFDADGRVVDQLDHTETLRMRNQAFDAVRRDGLGEDVDYYFNIYNPRLDPAGRPHLQTQLRIFRDGQPVYAGKPVAFDPGQQTDMKLLHEGTRVRLGGLAPGEYVLQVVVTDLLAPEKRNAVAQWTDFEIGK